jgi:hypothetical protein
MKRGETPYQYWLRTGLSPYTGEPTQNPPYDVPAPPRPHPPFADGCLACQIAAAVSMGVARDRRALEQAEEARRKTAEREENARHGTAEREQERRSAAEAKAQHEREKPQGKTERARADHWAGYGRERGR